MDQDTENRVERRRRRRRGIVALLGAISMLTIGAGSISLAQFTDTAGATWNFTAGTIDISVNPTALAAINPMMPGDVNTQKLVVTNSGTGDLRYAISVAATNALGSALQLAIRVDNGTNCATFTGTLVLATTTLNGAAVGLPAQGADAGDRNLAAGANESLCFRVSLPLSTGNASQGATSVATFTFDAEQTANNP
jgi:spore coat-associated protein N